MMRKRIARMMRRAANKLDPPKPSPIVYTGSSGSGVNVKFDLTGLG